MSRLLGPRMWSCNFGGNWYQLALSIPSMNHTDLMIASILPCQEEGGRNGKGSRALDSHKSHKWRYWISRDIWLKGQERRFGVPDGKGQPGTGDANDDRGG